MLTVTTADESDTVSLSSQLLKLNPLLSRKSEESISTLANDEREFSATESLQDLRQISLLPTHTGQLPPDFYTYRKISYHIIRYHITS